MSNPWKFDKGESKDSKPLGRNVERFIMENPQWVLYLRRNMDFVCPDHWDPASETKKLMADCTVCWGLGYSVNPIIVPSRISLFQASLGPTEGDFRMDPGYVQRFYAAIDFPRAVKPALEDLVLVCEWNKPTQTIGQYPKARVLRINTIYQIKQINDHFEREISWYNCGVKVLDVDKKDLDRMVNRLQNIRVMQQHELWSNQKFW